MRILTIPDTHFPFCRKSLFKDLRSIIKDTKPDLIVHMGDLVDLHAISRHQPEADSYGAVTEIAKARNCIKDLASIIGKIPVKMCMGNHDTRIFKQATTVRIPAEAIKPYKDLFSVPASWSIQEEHIVDNIVFLHGKSPVRHKVSLNYGMSSVQGHYHTMLGIEYTASSTRMLWSAFAGAAADDAAFSMRYAVGAVNKSAYGFIFIDNKSPRIIIP